MLEFNGSLEFNGTQEFNITEQSNARNNALCQALTECIITCSPILYAYAKMGWQSLKTRCQRTPGYNDVEAPRERPRSHRL